jgi:hypothetical protein
MNVTLIALIALTTAAGMVVKKGARFEVPEAEAADLQAAGKAKPAPVVELVKARVLTDCSFGKCNSVVSIPADVAEASKDVLDSNPAAIEYAESLVAE